MSEKHLTKKDLWSVLWHQMAIRGANNYERQQNAGFVQAMIPVIDRVYDTDEEKKAAYERHLEYFLTQDMVTAIPIGIAAAMEESHANNPHMDPSSINAVKTALMGPLAGLGDSLLNGTARPILASIGISFIEAGLGLIAGQISNRYGSGGEKIRFGIKNLTDQIFLLDETFRVAHIEFFDLRGITMDEVPLSEKEVLVWARRLARAMNDGVTYPDHD